MAQAILLADVESLGTRGEAVDVSPGYLRNYLVPRKLAQPATKGALEEAQRRLEQQQKAEREAAERAEEIADAIREARNLKIDRRKIRLEQPIHETGTYMVDIELPGGATASVKTIVADEN